MTRRHPVPLLIVGRLRDGVSLARMLTLDPPSRSVSRAASVTASPSPCTRAARRADLSAITGPEATPMPTSSSAISRPGRGSRGARRAAVAGRQVRRSAEDAQRRVALELVHQATALLDLVHHDAEEPG